MAKNIKVLIVTIEEEQSKLTEIIGQLRSCEEIRITDQGEPLARVKKSERRSWPCQAGTAKDSILWIAANFDEPLEEFQEYVE